MSLSLPPQHGVEAVFEEKTNGDFLIHLKLDTNAFGRALKSMTDAEWGIVLETTARGMMQGFGRVKDARYPLTNPGEMLFGRDYKRRGEG